MMVAAEAPQDYVETEETTREGLDIDTNELLEILRGYLDEAKKAREGGADARDATWQANWDSYWSRYDTSTKAEWQAKQTLPKVASFTERQVSVLQEALTSEDQWYTIEDILDPNSRVPAMIEKVVDLMLSKSGRNGTGQKIGFPSTFGDILKSGCMMALCGSVTWKDNRVLIEAVDPREIWLDPTGQGLYRIRRRNMDRHEVVALAKKTDSAGNPLYDREAIERLEADWDQELKTEKERTSGSAEDVTSGRVPVKIDEFLCDIVNNKGECLARNQLVVMANEREIIRKPEPNPFWHGHDWILFVPMISIPFSVYGRSYVETFRQLADTYQESVNLLLDGVFTTSQKAFMAWPEYLADPNQLNDGIHPNKIFIASAELAPGEGKFIEAIELGRLPGEAFQILLAMKSELHEDAGADELSMGQMAPKSDTTATEVVRATQGSESLKKPAARVIDERFLSPMVELVWFTALQHMDPKADPELARELGPELSAMFVARRQEFRNRRFKIKAHGVSGWLKKRASLRGLLGFLNVVGANPALIQAYQQQYSIPKLLGALLRGFGVDTEELRLGPEDKAAALPAPSQAPPGPGGGNLVDLNPGKTEGRIASGQE